MGHASRWGPSLVERGSHEQGGGGAVLMGSAGCHPLFDRSLNRVMESKREWFLWRRLEWEGGRE